MPNSAEQPDQLSPVKRALLEIRALKARLEEHESRQHEPIAIIGMGLRFPGGARDPESAWRLLRNGVDAITEVPRDRWDIDAYYDPDPEAPGKMSTRWGGFIEGIDKFDADFFGISPREAMSMDPQQRLLLPVAWEALENAGVPAEKLVGSLTGVFIGIASFDYAQMQMQFVDPKNIDAYLATGSSHSVSSGRLSYFFGLQGPSISLDTACSSSLVGVHLACQSLRQRDCNLALVGGVNLIIAPELLINFSKSHMMAADGRCKTFDARADGFVRGEGAAMIVLKRLADALADGDTIRAVIRGSAINQDGRSSGLTAPNGPSQQAVIRKALANAGIAPHEVSYVETHGTGTALGDPIEVQALGAVLREGRSPDKPAMIGSIKTNIGHLETAAGVAGLIKVVLALQHQEIPPHLHLQTLSPHIPWQELPVIVPTQRTPWPAGGGRRIAGVSSFGFSGTNAHVIVEEFSAAVISKHASGNGESETDASAPATGNWSGRPLHLLNLSAKTEPALRELAQRYEQYFAGNPSVALSDACFTANAGRSHFDHRLSIVADSAERMRQKLAAFLAREEAPGVYGGWSDGTNRPEVVFLFTGQGGQYLNMGRQLYDTQPTFRQALDRCAGILRNHLERPLLEVLFGEGLQSAASHLLDDTNYTQPATFALQYALAELWRSWGIVPGLIMGHSVGEIVAATVAGMMSLEDGLMIVSERGRLMHGLPHNGLMASILADERRVAEAIAPYADSVAIAAINGPESTVISGERRAVQEILQSLEAAGLKTRPLQVSNSFHSPLVEPVLDEFERSCRRAQFKTPAFPLFSSMRLEMVTPDRLLDAAYWRHNLRHTVRYAEAMQKLYELGHRVFVEIGPAPVLVVMGQKCFPQNEGVWLPSLRPGRGDWEQMLESLATLYVHGVKPDWEGFDRDYPRRRLALPNYPFQEQSYWIEVDRGAKRQEEAESRSSLLDLRWGALAEAGLHQSRQIPLDMPLHTYPEKWRVLDRLTTAYITQTLRALAIFRTEGEKHAVPGLLQRCQILPTYTHLLERWLKKLVAEGVLRQDGESFVSTRPLPELSPENILQEAAAVFTDIPELLEYLARCGRLLVPVLTGKESPLETLFPGGANATSEFLYHRWALSRYYTAIARAAVEALVRALPGSSHLSFLEVGAGTGGTTAAILPVLPADRTAYVFTDMSEYFFTQAAERFQAYPFLRYGILNIEKPPQEQGFGRHAFDAVVAANVLHATRNLHATVQNVLSLLKPGGVLILYETTHQPSWFDVSIALIEGWQLFEDDLRSGIPLIPAAQWEQLLRAHGFEHVAVFPEPGSPAEILSQHVIIAQGPRAAQNDGTAIADARAVADSQRAPGANGKAGARAGEERVKEYLLRLEEAPGPERLELLLEYVRGHVTRILRRDRLQAIGRSQRLMELGIDSLMAVELRNVLATGLGLKESLPATLIFDYPNIEAIARLLEKKLFAEAAAPAHPAAAPRGRDSEQQHASARLAELSDEEVEKMLEKKLEML